MKKDLISLEEVKKMLDLDIDTITTWKELKDAVLKNSKPNLAMLVDFYEFTMSQTFFDTGCKDQKVYFDLFFRSNPFNGGYAISSGLSDIIDFVKDFHFNQADIEYLRSQGCFNEEYLKYLSNLKFTGDIWAIPDGTPIFPNEPVITVRANVIEAQLLETLMLAYFNHASLVTTSAKRITNAIGDVLVSEFGARRGHGESVTKGAKAAIIGGCSATSNTQAAMIYGINQTGTMAHSMIEFYGNDYDAFLAYAKSNPNNCVFLVDTYNTLKRGIPAAIKVAQDYLIPNGYPFKGIRIDSGDLADLSKRARKLLDEAGFFDTKIFLTNGLNENTILSLKSQGAVIEAIGAGDNIIAPKERMNGVYKLVAKEENDKIIPCIKLSEDEIKITNPGFKKVYRFYDNKTGYALGDLIALADEVIPLDKYTLISPKEEWKQTELTNYTLKELQVPIFINGNLVYDTPTINESRNYADLEFKTLYEEVTRSLNPHEYYVDLSEKLLNLKKDLICENKYPEKVKVHRKEFK